MKRMAAEREAIIIYNYKSKRQGKV